MKENPTGRKKRRGLTRKEQKTGLASAALLLAMHVGEWKLSLCDALCRYSTSRTQARNEVANALQTCCKYKEFCCRAGL